LPLRDTLAGEADKANRDVPIFMCHGQQDPVVPLQLGELSRDALQTLGYAVDFRSYDMPHSVCTDEVRDIASWLSRVLQ
jgi:phospholipase/carboxylesterase